MILVLGRRSGGFWLGAGLFLPFLVLLRIVAIVLVLVLFLVGYVLRRLYLSSRRKRIIAAMSARSSQITPQVLPVPTRASGFLQVPNSSSDNLPPSFCARCGKQLPLPSVSDRYCQYCGSALARTSCVVSNTASCVLLPALRGGYAVSGLLGLHTRYALRSLPLPTRLNVFICEDLLLLPTGCVARSLPWPRASLIGQATPQPNWNQSIGSII